MRSYAGMDVSLAETSVCVVDEDGKIIKAKVASEPRRLQRGSAISRRRLPVWGWKQARWPVGFGDRSDLHPGLGVVGYLHGDHLIGRQDFHPLGEHLERHFAVRIEAVLQRVESVLEYLLGRQVISDFAIDALRLHLH